MPPDNCSNNVKDPDHRKPANIVTMNIWWVIECQKTATKTQCFHENKLMHLLNKMSSNF